jgi:hypothetical protein
MPAEETIEEELSQTPQPQSPLPEPERGGRRGKERKKLKENGKEREKAEIQLDSDDAAKLECTWCDREVVFDMRKLKVLSMLPPLPPPPSSRPPPPPSSLPPPPHCSK